MMRSLFHNFIGPAVGVAPVLVAFAIVAAAIVAGSPVAVLDL